MYSRPALVSEGCIQIFTRAQNIDAAAFDEQSANAELPSLEEGERLAKRFLDIAACRPSRVLDLGCGRGALTLGLARLLPGVELYAVDHSLGSLRTLAAAMQGSDLGIDLSCQDALDLRFRPGAFDLVVSNAFLHHITDCANLLCGVRRILAPNGIAIFSEPWRSGYLLAASLLHAAATLLKVDLRKPEYGMCAFLIEDVRYRIAHAEDLTLLDRLVDKHLFTDDQARAVAKRAGFSKVDLIPYEHSDFYNEFMSEMLRVSGVSEPEFCATVRSLWNSLKRVAGPAVAEAGCHFKFIRLE